MNGYLDDLEIGQIRPFEDGLLASLRSDNAALLDQIREEKALSDEISGKLTAAIEAFAKTFA